MPRNANQSKSTNYSLNFDGNDAIEIPQTTATDITGSNTIATWVKRSTSGSNQNLVNKRGTGGTQYAFFIETTNLLGFDDGTGAKAYGNTVIPIDVWTHVAVVIESGGCTFYVNGVADGGVSSNISVGANTHTTYIGKKYSNTFYLNGKLSQVCFFDYALSASQITTLYGDSTNGPGNPMALPRTPIAYYSLGTSVWNGDYLVVNNAIEDYVFNFIPNDSIDTNFTLPNYSDYSYSFWIKNTGSTSGSDQWILGNSSASVSGDTGSRGAVRINNSTKIRIFGGDDSNYYRKQYNFTAGNAQGNTNIFDGKWYNIVITFTSGTIVFYVNGVAQTHESTGTTGTPITGFAANNSYRIGQSGVNTGYLNHSELSNVQIFNTVLSQSDAETLYNYGSPIQTLANIPQSSNLKAWYKLDAGEIYNSTSTKWSVDNNQNTSAYISSLKFVASELDRIDIPHDTILNPSSNYTFSIWFNPTSSNSHSSLFGSSILNRGVNMYYPPNNTKVTFYHKTSTANENFDIVFPDSPVDTWNNVTVTWSASTGIIRAFINGKYISQKENISDIVWSGQLKVGQYTSYAWYFDGQLSNLAMWDVTLTDGFSGTPTSGDVAGGQVAEVYNNGTPQASITGSPVGWWKLNNGGKFITDSSGNNFTATNHSGNFQTGGAIEYAGFVNRSAGKSSGMSQSNLVQSDLQTVAPYSKYAIEFDHTDADYIDLTSDINLGSTMSFSVWLKTDHVNPSGIPQNTWVKNITGGDGFFNFNMLFGQGLTNGRLSNYVANTSGATGFDLSTNPLNDNIWHHCFVTFDGSTLKSYIDGSLNVTIEGITAWTSNIIKTIGRYDSANIRYFDGILSNMAVWNSALTASQAREVYNQGLPGNLNIFSGPAPVAWWQLGEGSSYAGGWIFADEIGSIDGEGQNLTEINLVNGVGTTANGTSTGMGVEALVSDAPYSTGNAMSVNMSSAAKGSNTP